MAKKCSCIGAKSCITRLLGRRKGSGDRFMPFTGDGHTPFAPINVIYSPMWWSEALYREAEPEIIRVFGKQYDLKIDKEIVDEKGSFDNPKHCEMVIGKEGK